MDRPHPLPTKSDHAIKLVQKLYRFATRNKHTNFSIKTDEATVQCHSPVLCAQSPFIDGLCATGVSEANIKFQQPVTHVKQALEQVRRYFYLGMLKLNEDIVEPVLVMAQKMAHEELLAECERFSISILNISNCAKLIKIADTFHLVSLNRACQELKKAKFSILMSEDWFLPSLHVDELIRYLADDQLGVSSEDEALDAVRKWLIKCTATDERKEQYADMLVPLVRLTRCDEGKLEAAAEPTNTSTPSALKVRIMHFLRKKDVRGPENPRRHTEEVTVIVGGRKEGNTGHREIFYPNTRRISVPFPDAFDFSFYSVCRKGSTLYLSGGYSLSKKKSVTAVFEFCCERGTLVGISNLPCARAYHGSARIGNRLYIIGGCYMENGDIKTWHRIVNVLHLESMTWATLSDLPHGVYHPAIVVVDASLYLFGGWLVEGGYSRKVVKYEPHTDTWRGCSDMPQVGAFCVNSSVAVRTNIYVLAWDKFLCYDTELDEWSSLDTPPMPSYFCSLLYLNGTLVASGGLKDLKDPEHPHNRRQQFDLRSRKWSLLEDAKSLPLALFFHYCFVTRVSKSS